MKFNEQIRYEYDLNKNSIVFDVGSHLGVFTKGIFDKYHCNIYAFEPIKIYFKEAKKEFNSKKIKSFNFGLLNRNFETKMTNIGNSSGLFNDNEKGETVIIKDILEIVKNIDSIDLIKINIEGGEYDLLSHILNNGDITIFKNIQIQYHIQMKDKRQNINIIGEKEEITKRLEQTHLLQWWFPVWESWKIK